MSTDVVIVDGLTGGTNTNVVKVITQTNNANGATVNTQVNKGYIFTSSSLQTVNLPGNPTVGDVIGLHGEGTGLFRVVQAPGEQIILGDKQTTPTVGFIESTHPNDELYLLCIGNSGIWKNDGGFGGVFNIEGATTNNTINNTVSGDDVTAVDATEPTSQDITIINDGTGPELKFKFIEDNQSLANGVSASNSPNRIILTCNNPDQTVALTGGTDIDVVGTYPNFTISSTSTSSSDSGFVQMEDNFWAGKQATFDITFKELLPTGATYYSDLSTNFTNPSNAVLKYIGAETKKFKISAFYTLTASGSTAITIAVNGTPDANAENYFFAGTVVNLQFSRDLAQNDEVSVYVLKSAPLGNRNVSAFALSVWS